jgi:hypothetical protein
MKTIDVTPEVWATLDAAQRKGYCARRSAERRLAKSKGQEIPPTMAEQLEIPSKQKATPIAPTEKATVEPVKVEMVKAPAKVKKQIVDNDLIRPKKKAPAKPSTRKEVNKAKRAKKK